MAKKALAGATIVKEELNDEAGSKLREVKKASKFDEFIAKLFSHAEVPKWAEDVKQPIKSFIDTHFIAKEDLMACRRPDMKGMCREDLYTKDDLLSMVGEDEVPKGFIKEYVPPSEATAVSVGYFEAKAEIRDRINGRISRHDSNSKDIQTKEKD